MTVNTTNSIRYADHTLVSTNHSLVNGTNTFTAIARDNLGRTDTNVSTAYLPSNSAFVCDSNGNMVFDGQKAFEYDDENQLTRITATNAWKSEFTYDGKMRRRVRKEYTWRNSAWALTNEVRYVYDGNLVIQERDANDLAQATYTRGKDLSGNLEGAGGIGGLLARTDHSTLTLQPSAAHAYYHADAGGNITMLVSTQQVAVAKYFYDPFGNMLSRSGPLANANLYRFSSKESHENGHSVYFLYRYYAPAFHRWLNRDPIQELWDINLYRFVRNNSISGVDKWGLQGIIDAYPDDDDFTQEGICRQIQADLNANIATIRIVGPDPELMKEHNRLRDLWKRYKCDEVPGCIRPPPLFPPPKWHQDVLDIMQKIIDEWVWWPVIM